MAATASVERNTCFWDRLCDSREEEKSFCFFKNKRRVFGVMRAVYYILI